MHGCSQTSISASTTNPNFRSAGWAITGQPPALGGIRGDLKQKKGEKKKKKAQLRQPRWAAELEEDQMTTFSLTAVHLQLDRKRFVFLEPGRVDGCSDIILWCIVGF